MSLAWLQKLQLRVVDTLANNCIITPSKHEAFKTTNKRWDQVQKNTNKRNSFEKIFKIREMRETN